MKRIVEMLLMSLIITTGCGNNAPKAPADLNVNALSDGSIRINWSDWSEDEDCFAIYESHADENNFGLLKRTNSNVDTVIIKGKTPGERYTYYVRSFRGSSESQPTAKISILVPLVQIPVQPTGLKASVDAMSKAKLSWNDNSTNEDGFEIERKEETEVEWTLLNKVGADINGFSDTETGEDVKYFYRVRSFNQSGKSDWSNETNIVIKGTREVRVIYPNGGESFGNDNDMVIRWKADPTIGLIKIYFRTQDENFWYTVAKNTPNDGIHEFSDVQSLIESETYKVRIATTIPTLYDESDGFFTVRH